MSICSFVSDEANEDIDYLDNPSFLDISLDRTSFPSNNSNNENLKKLQALLFQTNFYLQKLEEKMKETQRRVEVEVCIRQMRSHQTVLNLKLNAQQIDNSFMKFVIEKQKKLLEEVNKVLEVKSEVQSCIDIDLGNNCETTGISSPQITPAFSGHKSFFREYEGIDLEISQKINAVFFNFFQHPSESEAIDCIFENYFTKKYPKTGESLQKVVKSIGMYRAMSRRDSQSSREKKWTANSRIISSHVQEYFQKAVDLKEFHLNLENLKNRSIEERVTNCTQTNESSEDLDECRGKVIVLEGQLQELNIRLYEMQEENRKIKSYQRELVEKIKTAKGEDKENSDFLKERYENSNRLLANLQDAHRKIGKENEILKADLKKRTDINIMIVSKVNSTRYEISAIIKELEKIQKILANDLIDEQIAALHQISLKLLNKDAESTRLLIPRSAGSKAQVRSRSNLKTASEQLELYILNNY